MTSESDEKARRDAESIERQVRMLEQRRAETGEQTKGSLRRVALVVVTTALVALALWLLME